MLFLFPAGGEGENGRDVMPKDLKRSLTIAGHRTSLSLEPEFWEALRNAAALRGLSVSDLVSEIDQTRGSRNLSSAVRVWLLKDGERLLRG
jgi:predicted DNA-binding ribbon-helix-helix protein